MVSYTPTSITASTTLSQARHGDGGIVVNAAAGLTLTLPAASGSGAKFDILIGTAVTSNTVVIKVANASDTMTGNALSAADVGDTLNAWEAGATADTITLNGSTTGGLVGDRIKLTDLKANLWAVEMVSASTGTEATPFSATV